MHKRVMYTRYTSMKSNVDLMPRLAKVQLQGCARNVEAQQAQKVATKERQEGGKEQLAAGHKRQSRVAKVRDVDVLEAGDEEEGAGGSANLRSCHS